MFQHQSSLEIFVEKFQLIYKRYTANLNDNNNLDMFQKKLFLFHSLIWKSYPQMATTASRSLTFEGLRA